MSFMDGARARASAWAASARDKIKMPELPSWWKRKDVTAERAAVAAQIHPLLISGFFIAAYSAALVEVSFMFLRVVRMVGDYHWKVEFDGSRLPPWTSEASFTIHPVLAVVLFAASAVVVWFSMLWIPGQLALRGQGAWRRLTLVTVGVICNVYILSNVIVGGQANRTEDLRDAMVIEQQAGQSRAQTEARIADIDVELDRLCDRSRNNDYNAAACNAGEAAYRATAMSPEMLAREEPARRRIIERAVQSAIRADALRAERQQLRAELAAGPTQAAVAATLTDDAGRGMATFAAYVDAYGYVALGLALSLVAIFGNLWGLGLLQARALLDPDAPKEEAEAARAEAREDAAAAASAPGAGDGGGEAAEEALLELPPLPDLRGVEEPEFDALAAAVDEEGRVLRKFSGWRAPRAKNDKRRAPEPDENTMAMADIPAPAADELPAAAGDETEEDAADWIRRQAQQTEGAK